MTNNQYSEFLQHHGIKGMHWGIRRFQPYPKGHKGGKEVGEAGKSKREKKKNKVERKIEKAYSKYDKKRRTANGLYAKGDFNKSIASIPFASNYYKKRADKWYAKADKKMKKVIRLERKGAKYYKKMKKKFDKMDIVMSDDAKSKGEAFLNNMYYRNDMRFARRNY